MITELTPEQEKKRDEYREEGLRLGTSTERVNRDSATKAVLALYKACGMQTEPAVYFADGPTDALRILDLLKAGKEVTEEGIKSITTPKLDFNFGLGNQGLYWIQFHRFINNELPIEKKLDNVDVIFDFMHQVGWFWPYEKAVIISDRPTKISLVNERLHCTDGPAISYLDGTKVFAVKGVLFHTEEQFNRAILNPEPEFILRLKNVSQRAAAINLLGVANMFDKLNPRLIEEGDISGFGYTLYGVNIIPEVERKYIKMINPSTGEFHIEAVHPECKNIQEAIHYRLHGTPKINNGEFSFPEVLT